MLTKTILFIRKSFILLVLAGLVLVNLGGVGGVQAVHAQGAETNTSFSAEANDQCLTHLVFITLDSEQISFCAPTNLPSNVVEDNTTSPNATYAQLNQITGYGVIRIQAVVPGNTPGVEMPIYNLGKISEYRQAILDIESSKTDRTVSTGPIGNFWQETVPSIQINTTLGAVSIHSVEWFVEYHNHLWVFVISWDTALGNQDEWGTASTNFSIQKSDSSNFSDTAIDIGAAFLESQSSQDISTLGGVVDVGTPSWWSGTCDDNHYFPYTGIHSSPLGSSWHGLITCGPRPFTTTHPDYPVAFYSGAHQELEFECVELVMRFLYQEWGIIPWAGNGNQIKNNYDPNLIVFNSNGAHSMVPGDILTENGNSGGHTAIITSVSLDSNGTGTINILEQNANVGGSRSLHVTNWNVDPDPGLSSQTIQGWLHVKANGGGGGGGTNNPPAGYTKCADEGGRCNFSGTADVVYGALNSFTSPRSFTNGVDCNNGIFGDPINGTGKSCYYKPTGGGGSSCPTLSGQVNLYDQTNCGGDSVTANNTGLWNLASNFNDRAESIAIPSGWSARLYQNDNENSNESACFGSTDTNLNDNTFANGGGVGNSATWMRVYDNSSCSGGAPVPSAPPQSTPGNGSNNPYNYNLNFQWNSSSGATEYLVEWWGGPYNTMQPCGWSSSTSCQVGTVAAGNTYSWHVKARNGSGESGWSSTWTFTIQSQTQPPSAPSLSSPGNGSSNPYNYDLNFQWNSSSGATEYLIEWWGGPYSTMQPCGWSSSTSCHIGNVAAGNTYSWHVKARNGAGESGWSSTWAFTIQSQSLPVLAEFDTWPPSGDAPFTTAFHIVDMSNITSCFWEYGDGQTGTTCTQLHNHTYNNPGLYTVSLTVNGPGTSDYMIRTDYIAVSDSSAPPAPPSDPAVIDPTTNSLTLTWQDNSNTETGFNIYRWGYDGTDWTFLYLDSVGADETSYTQYSLACGSDFNFYEVSAYNGNGESDHTGWVQGATSDCPPADLSITNLTLDQDAVYTNDNAYLNIEVENSSDANASGFWIDVYTDRQPTGCADWGSYYVWINELDANSTNTWTIKIPAGDLTEGSHDIYAFVDSGCAIAENDENNNLTGPTSLFLAAPPPAPAHDDFDGASLISSVPYSDFVDVSGATMTWDDPAASVSDCNLNSGLASVWYQYTPSATIGLNLDTLGSSYDTYIAVWTGSRGNLSPIACNDDSVSNLQSNLQVTLTAGTTYFIEVAQYNGALTTSALQIVPRIRLKPGQDIQAESNPGKNASTTKPKPGTDIGTLAGGLLNFHVSVITYTSMSASTQDGWILESSELSKKGGTMNSTAATFNLGDDRSKKQYLGILSFSTASLPDNAHITGVTLKLKKSAIVGGGNPVTTFQGFMVDIKKGLFGTAALQAADFQTAASKSYGPFKTALVGGWYNISLASPDAYINKLSTNGGLTQIRLRFKLDDNNNAVANYLSLFSGNAPAANRPQLVIQYYVLP